MKKMSTDGYIKEFHRIYVLKFILYYIINKGAYTDHRSYNTHVIHIPCYMVASLPH